MRRHVLEPFGQVRLRDLNHFDLQRHVNDAAKRFSRSTVTKMVTWLRATLAEAVEQGYLEKNPARRLVVPPTKASCRRFLSLDEVRRLLGAMRGQDRIIVHMLLVCALRPGELFALRWRHVEPGRLRIEQAISQGRLGEPKTGSSNGYVALPASVQAELAMWRSGCAAKADDFVFPSKRGTPMDPHNYLTRVLQPGAREAGIEGVTFQALRRTFATHFQRVGTVKDAQTQLRHASPLTTLKIYTQVIPDHVLAAVEALDREFSGILNTI